MIPFNRDVFSRKLQHSIELLQKSEKIAKLYSPNGYYLSFSGGKDSQALYHVAKMAGVSFKAHMNLTSVDPPEVIRFVKEHYPDVDLIKPADSIYNVAIKKQILPTRKNRWCCEVYKEEAGAGNVVLLGIRREESTKRAKRNELEVSRRKFSGDIESFDQWREKTIRKKLKISNEDYFDIDQETTTHCVSGKDKIMLSPIIDWTYAEVWYFLNEVVGAAHCSLYDQGYHRIGCLCCPMSNIKQRRRELDQYPHLRRNWIRTIGKMMERGNFRVFDSPEDVFDWWLSDIKVKDYLAQKKYKQLSLEL